MKFNRIEERVKHPELEIHRIEVISRILGFSSVKCFDLSVVIVTNACHQAQLFIRADLTTQTALNYEIGIQSSYGEKYPGGSLALFRSDVDDLIARRDYGTDFQYQNIAEAVLQGVELSLFWYPLDGLGLFTNYTFLDSENKATGNELDFRPPHVLNLEARYQAPFGFTTGIIYSYVSSQTYVPKSQPDLVETLPDRGLWEIYLAQKYPFERFSDRHVEIYLSIENLLDEYYEEDPRYAAPGRRVWAGIRGTF